MSAKPQVFVSVGISVDGFIAGLNGGPGNPLGDGGTRLHEWAFKQRSFRQLHGEAGGETGRDNEVIEEMIERIGANLMGKRMFEEGEPNWPDEAPFHTAVFVLTHERRAPWKRRGGTTFYFVNEGIEVALTQALDAAGGKDIRISGGADTVRQYLDAGHVHELQLHVAPVLLGQGVRLFEGLDPERISMEPREAVHAPMVTHLRYGVKKC
ncbi:MAG: dihydrofolate reductase [Gemmatimonadetes bacterium]|nr:dihydrofolate reductase [Gemmatimonadota bacterium]